MTPPTRVWAGGLGLTLAYCLLFATIVSRTNSTSAAALASVPVAWFGWHAGRRLGLLASAAALALTIVLLLVLGYPPASILARHWLPGGLTLILVGIGSGWAGEMARRLRQQRAALDAERQRLARAIEERMRAEQALRLIQAAVEHASDAVLLLAADEHGHPTATITYANPSARRCTANQPERLAAAITGCLRAGRADGALIRHYLRPAPELHCGEASLHGADGACYLEWTCTPVYEPEGGARHWVVTGRDISERKRHEAYLRRMAFFDALTGLPNRRLFLRQLERALTHPPDRQQRPAVLFLDLNEFKQVNDHYGHRIGDALLVEVARRIERPLTARECAGRLSGDEFAILVWGNPAATRARAVADALLQLFATPCQIGCHQIQVHLSIGIAAEIEGVSATDLLDHADAAMYRAKARARTCATTSVVVDLSGADHARPARAQSSQAEC